MYKKLQIVLPVMVVLLLSVFLLTAPTSTAAKAIEPPTPGIADGSWQWDNPEVTGVTSPVNLVAAPKPQWADVMNWEQITLSGPATLCHPFRGGQFGWVGEIRIFTGKSWEPIASTNQWVPDVEGTFMVCAKVPSAGTYALFGGYVKPADAGMPECDFPVSLLFYEVSNSAPSRSGKLPFQLVAAVLDDEHQPAVGTPASYTLSDIQPVGSMTGAMKGSTTFQYYTEYPWYTDPIAIFDEIVYIDIYEVTHFYLHFVSMGCYVDINAQPAAVVAP